MIGFETEDEDEQRPPRPRWRSALTLSGGFLSLLLVTMVLILVVAGLVWALAWFGVAFANLSRG